MIEKRFEFREVNNCGITPKVWDNEKQEYLNLLESCKVLNELHEENEQLSAMKSKGLKVLEFYEYKLKNADKKEFENAREELWIVKEVLCEMEVIKDEWKEINNVIGGC